MTDPTTNWRAPLDRYVKSMLAEAKEPKTFYGIGNGIARVQGDIATLRHAIERLETMNRAN